MKKGLALLLVLILIMVRPIWGQITFKTNKNLYGTWNNNSGKYNLENPREANIDFTVYEIGIKVSDENESFYRIINKTADERTKDGKMLTFECKDEIGRTCYFTYMNYDDPEREDTIMVMYTKTVYVYFIYKIITDGD